LWCVSNSVEVADSYKKFLLLFFIFEFDIFSNATYKHEHFITANKTNKANKAKTKYTKTKYTKTKYTKTYT